MSDLERNKRIAVEFLELAFNEDGQRRPPPATRAPRTSQHNPHAADGPLRSSSSRRPSRPSLPTFDST